MNAHIRQVVESYFDALLRPDFAERIGSLYRPDVQLHEVLGEFTGLAGVDAQVLARQREIVPGLHIEVLQVLEDGVECAVRWRVTGTVPDSGRPLETEGTTWMRFEAGLIAEIWACWDAGTLLPQFQGARRA